MLLFYCYVMFRAGWFACSRLDFSDEMIIQFWKQKKKYKRNKIQNTNKPKHLLPYKYIINYTLALFLLRSTISNWFACGSFLCDHLLIVHSFFASSSSANETASQKESRASCRFLEQHRGRERQRPSRCSNHHHHHQQ